ncbi:hypothetical protein ES703_66402 [subsurface metagenome]
MIFNSQRVDVFMMPALAEYVMEQVPWKGGQAVVIGQ